MENLKDYLKSKNNFDNGKDENGKDRDAMWEPTEDENQDDVKPLEKEEE